MSEYTLNITSAGADSGLNDVLSGEDVLLRINVDGDVEGYTSGSGDVVFRVSVNGSGIVELDIQFHNPASVHTHTEHNITTA